MESSRNIDISNSLSDSFKIKRSSTFHSKTPRLLDGLEYQHKYSESELQIKLTSYLTQKQHIETSLLEILMTSAKHKSNKFIPKRAYATLENVIERIKCLPVIYYAVTKNFEHMEKENNKTNWDELFQWDIEKLNAQKDAMFALFPQYNLNDYEEVVNGTRIICASSVLISLNCVETIINRIY